MSEWKFDNLELIDGCNTEILGTPKKVATEAGTAVEFDGVGDALLLDSNPLAGLEEFTIEIVFQPYPDGLTEQRFFHMQEDGSQSRVLFETRLTEGNRWFLDTFIRVGETGYIHFAEDFQHPVGPWYHAAITVGGGRFRHYVNGELELESEIAYVPQKPGRTSLGVRLNRVCWYKGAVRAVRLSPRPLEPMKFLTV